MDTMAVKPFFRRTAVLLLVLFISGFSGCRQEEVKNSAQQQHIESMMTILTQVQKNLSRIRQKEAVVERLSSDIENKEQKSAEQIGKDIYDNIRFIDSTLAASKSLVSKLEKENQSSGYRVVALDKLSQELRKDLDEKDSEIKEMKTEIQKLNKQVSRLLSTVDVLDEFIIDQENRMSTAYYIVGTVNDLASKGIIIRSSPLAQLFGNNYAIATDFDISQFRSIDITETKDLFFDKPLKRLNIVTPHSRGSYELVGGDTSSLLLIKDENEFWKKSRCLVIVVD
jgi:hypothetical protein